jgi:hypothetical protein
MDRLQTGASDAEDRQCAVTGRDVAEGQQWAVPGRDVAEGQQWAVPGRDVAEGLRVIRGGAPASALGTLGWALLLTIDVTIEFAVEMPHAVFLLRP